MNIAFIASAALMMIAAIAVLVFPTLRAGPGRGQSRGLFLYTLMIALASPALALGIYLAVGTPQALTQAIVSKNWPASPTNADATIASLREAAFKQPEALQPWLILGQSAATMNKSNIALEAFSHALKIAPDDPDVMVAYAESVQVQNVNHQLDTSTRATLEHAIDLDPYQQHGLLLLGFADYQDGRFSDASVVWRRLSSLVPPGTAVSDAITRQIADADSLAQRANSRK